MAVFPNWSMDRNARQQLTGRRPTPTIRPFVKSQGVPLVHVSGQRREDDEGQTTAQLIRLGPGGQKLQVAYVAPNNPNAYRGITGRLYYSMLQFLAGTR